MKKDYSVACFESIATYKVLYHWTSDIRAGLICICGCSRYTHASMKCVCVSPVFNRIRRLSLQMWRCIQNVQLNNVQFLHVTVIHNIYVCIMYVAQWVTSISACFSLAEISQGKNFHKNALSVKICLTTKIWCVYTCSNLVKLIDCCCV